MKRRDFIKAVPAAALVPAALSARSESANAAVPQPKVGAGDSDLVVKAADKASSAGGQVPDWAEHFLTSDMDGTGPDGAPNGQTATFTGASKANATADSASSKMKLTKEEQDILDGKEGEERPSS